MINVFPEIKKNFGFGCMRFPMKGEEVDIEELKLMVDEFMDNGFNYFDTAHGYVKQQSETALKEALTSRYPRDSYVLTDKLTNFFFKKKEDIRPLFEQQLEACGVDYFDFYFMHAQSEEHFKYFKDRGAYEVALELKEEGKIKHFGISFHDKASVLDQILTEYPEIEFVQIQFNYLDYEDPSVEARKVYEVCVKHNKPVSVMEPIKGGHLVNLPEEAQKIYDDLPRTGSNASYALRFAAGFENVRMVLSGMSNIEQMRDNISFMKDFKPLDEKELEAVQKVTEVYKNTHAIQCTACRYCVDGCPKKILIPDMFACLNSKVIFKDWNADYYYNNVLTTKGHAKASECLKCGKCEHACPQHLPIRELLQQVASEFE